ncbi:hypothetical protein JCM16814_30450 [Desulfobaculum senezii]
MGADKNLFSITHEFDERFGLAAFTTGSTKVAFRLRFPISKESVSRQIGRGE